MGGGTVGVALVSTHITMGVLLTLDSGDIQ